MAALNGGSAGFNAGRNYYSRLVKLEHIRLDAEFASMFPVQKEILTELKRKIKESGYDGAQPIVVWKGENTLVDGHTRYRAVRELGIKEIPVNEKEFASREEAILYAYERQAIRRNLTAAEIMAAAQTLKNKQLEDRDGGGRAAEILAKRLGTSAATIYQARKIAVEANEEDLKAIQKGETTIRAVYQKVKSKTTSERVKLPEACGIEEVDKAIKMLKTAVKKILVMLNECRDGAGEEKNEKIAEAIRLLLKMKERMEEKAGKNTG
jgi:ParB-like chromosome segregation protein Spo0J